jgi:hypothetical protein
MSTVLFWLSLIGMCQAFIGNVSFNERRVFKMQLPELCSVYVYSKAHRLAAALV